MVRAYDKTGLVTAITSFDAAGREEDRTRFSYDPCGLVVLAENKASRVEYIRDKNGRVVEEDINGRRVKSRYDACGRRVERRVFSGLDRPEATRIGEHIARYAYDPTGLVEHIAIGAHEPLEIYRDGLGREVARLSKAGFRLDQAFDPVGQLTQQSFGRQTGEPYHRRYAWDRAGAPTSIDDVIWGEARYSYDGNGQVSAAASSDGHGERFAYDGARNLVGASATGQERRHWSRFDGHAVDEAGRGPEAGWQLTPGGVVEAARGPRGERVFLAHDACGRVVERRVERDGFRPKVWHYQWDALDRLIGCVTPDGARWTYAYDPFGRRLSKARRLREAELAWARMRFTEAFQRSGLGDAGLLAAAPQRPEGARSDGLPVVGRAYAYDGDQIIEDAPLRLGGEAIWAEATRWHYELETFRPLAKEDPDGTLSYIVADHLGTPRDIVSEQGTLVWSARYSTWGVLIGVFTPPAASHDDDLRRTQGRFGHTGYYGALSLAEDPHALAAVCPLRFPGQWQDEETGLYYNRHRHYDPLAAQYVSPDPIGLGGGDRPQGYVERPGVWTDPLGLKSTPSLPAFDGKTTHGMLRLNEGGADIPLRSDSKIPGYQNYPSSGHVEGKAAIIIRENNSTGGTVWHNNTNGTCGFCRSNVPTLLPEGSTLTIIPPEGAVAGNAQATIAPSTIIGNSAIPKIPQR